MVRLISMAMTGYYRTMQRPRVHQPLSMLKYDPIGTRFPCRHWQERAHETLVRVDSLRTWERNILGVMGAGVAIESLE